MNFPNHIKVIALKKESGDPAEGLAIMINLKMQFKNNYSIGPKFTNESGTVMFSQSEIIEEMEATKEGSPMDYIGGIESCKSIEAVVMGHAAIGRFVKARKIWGAASSRWRLSAEVIQALQHAINQSHGKESLHYESKIPNDNIVIYVQ